MNQNEFLFRAKMCSSKMSAKYAVWKANGKDVSGMLMKILLLNSFIKTLECNKPRKFYGDCCEHCTIKVDSCLSPQDFCIFVDKIKSICNC